LFELGSMRFPIFFSKLLPFHFKIRHYRNKAGLI
jgi:hypothetical protein